MNEFHYEILMNIFLVVLYFATSFWVYFDAREIRRVTENPKVNPIAWLMGCLLLWIVAFPIYIYYRFVKSYR